jgi:hypothetical protein
MPPSGFDGLAEPLDAFVTGGLRRECANHLVNTSRTMGDALGHLRLTMRTHNWRADGHRVNLARAVGVADALTRQ